MLKVSQKILILILFISLFNFSALNRTSVVHAADANNAEIQELINALLSRITNLRAQIASQQLGDSTETTNSSAVNTSSIEGGSNLYVKADDYQKVPNSSVLACDEPVVNAHEGPFDIIVLAGQSNAVGKGAGTYGESSTFKVQAENVFQLGRFSNCANKIIPITTEPLHNWDNDVEGSLLENDSDKLLHIRNRKGFAYPFALRYAHENSSRMAGEDRKVLIIPAARGGSSILQWDGEKGTFTGDNLDLYNDMISKVNYVLEEYPDSRVVNVLWQQGEADLANVMGHGKAPNQMDTVVGYGDALADLRRDFRNDTGETCAPFMMGEFVRSWEPSNYDGKNGLTVKSNFIERIKNVANGDPCGTSVFVSSQGATSNSEAVAGGKVKNEQVAERVKNDNIHFSAEGQHRLAKNYWSAYKESQLNTKTTEVLQARVVISEAKRANTSINHGKRILLADGRSIRNGGWFPLTNAKGERILDEVEAVRVSGGQDFNGLVVSRSEDGIQVAHIGKNSRGSLYESTEGYIEFRKTEVLHNSVTREGLEPHSGPRVDPQNSDEFDYLERLTNRRYKFGTYVGTGNDVFSLNFKVPTVNGASTTNSGNLLDQLLEKLAAFKDSIAR